MQNENIVKVAEGIIEKSDKLVNGIDAEKMVMELNVLEQAVRYAKKRYANNKRLQSAKSVKNNKGEKTP